MKGSVIGNGPSNSKYVPSGDMVIGCNIPNHEHSVNATLICDVEIIWILKNNPELVDCPLLLSTNAFECMKQLRMEDSFEILHTFEPKPWHNSGHYATLYLIANGCTEIKLYGCDSIFKESIDSNTDRFVEKDINLQKFIKHWNATWYSIMKSSPKVNFEIIK